jgi:exosome complex RNA-binding protein Rrp42 (RNase PH superfamily)
VDGAYRFLLYSSSNTLISGTEGGIITVNLVADNMFTGGSIVIDNALLVSPEQEETKPARYEYTIGTTTEVEEIITTQKSQRIYNLNGQLLKEPQRGINIIDGKKVVVR